MSEHGWIAAAADAVARKYGTPSTQGLVAETVATIIRRHATPVVLTAQPAGDEVEVRAAVGMDRAGVWYVYGYSKAPDDQAVDIVCTGDRAHVAWITARVPVPTVPTVPTIAANVEPIGGGA